jgi:hypothetical protein
VYEHFDSFIKHYSNDRAQFSTFGYDAVRQCETRTEKVPLQTFFPHVHDHVLPVYRCTSHVYTVQEQAHTLFTLKFANHQGNPK